ncbi:MAG: alpha/beta hydrolase, partial [Pseudomonadota bacterium]
MAEDLATAPLYEDVAEGPPGGAAYWLQAADGVRIRAAMWAEAGARGTILMFPGRTEYIEKYGRLAGDFRRAGYAMACIDWRGQGLADRAAAPRDLGHVGSFEEYQND